MRQGIVALLLLTSVSASAQTPAKTEVTANAQAAFKDIEATLGTVPGFFKVFPESALPGAWAAMKGVQLNPQTAIPAKQKELMGIAVAAQIPCDYCTYFHTQAARMHGATDEEIKLAVAEGSMTRFWSTYLYGAQVDMAQFKQDVDKMAMRVQRQQTAGTTSMPAMQIRDAASARKDIEQTFGFVPAYLAGFPEDALAGAWSEMKALEMTPGPISGKNMSLTSLAVASQIPCQYCTYADTSFARAQGASEREIKEAAALAATVRHWSTVLNGMQYDEAKFKKETDQMISALKKKQASR